MGSYITPNYLKLTARRHPDSLVLRTPVYLIVHISGETVRGWKAARLYSRQAAGFEAARRHCVPERHAAATRHASRMHFAQPRPVPTAHRIGTHTIDYIRCWGSVRHGQLEIIPALHAAVLQNDCSADQRHTTTTDSPDSTAQPLSVRWSATLAPTTK